MFHSTYIVNVWFIHTHARTHTHKHTHTHTNTNTHTHTQTQTHTHTHKHKHTHTHTCIHDVHTLVHTHDGQVFDVTRMVTYQHMNSWYRELRQYRKKIPCIVVANKIDGATCFIFVYINVTICSDLLVCGAVCVRLFLFVCVLCVCVRSYVCASENLSVTKLSFSFTKRRKVTYM